MFGNPVFVANSSMRVGVVVTVWLVVASVQGVNAVRETNCLYPEIDEAISANK